MKADDLSDDSEKNNIVCDLCEEDGIRLTAEGYCVDCNDFLCVDCFRFHRKPKPSKHHVLQDNKNMPQTKSTTPKDRRNEHHCQTHQGQTVLSYCTKHCSVVCKLCQMFDHRQCQKHEHLIDLNEVVLDTDQLADIHSQIVDLGEKLKNSKTFSTQVSENIKVSYNRVVKEITTIKESELQMSKDLGTTCDNMLLELVSMDEDLKRLSAKEEKLQLFLKLKKAQTLVETFECKLVQVRNDNKIFEYMFVKSDNQNISFGKLGTLVKRPIEPETINIKTEADAKDCHITGIAKLSEDKYVIADYNNKTVKHVDLTSKSVTLDFKVEMSPYDLTKTEENKIAITTFRKKIILIKISDTIAVYKTIGLNKDSRGITYIHDKLVVSNGCAVEMCTLNGNVKHTVRGKDEDNIVKFIDARYISQGVDTNTLYLTDGESNKVLSMTLNGDVLASFTHKYLKSPRGITCSRDGRIFVCSLGSHMIFEISSDLSQGHVILRQENGIFKPFSIFFSEEKQQLLVGSDGKNTILIFQF